MKKFSVLATTTLAGALLFTGVNAHAAESEVTSDNASNIATNVMKKAGQSPENVNFQEAKDKGDYYFLSYGNKSGVGVGGVRVYKDGTVSSTSGIRGADDNGKYFEKMVNTNLIKHKIHWIIINFHKIQATFQPCKKMNKLLITV